MMWCENIENALKQTNV